MKRLPISYIRTGAGIVTILALITGTVLVLTGITEGNNSAHPVEIKEVTETTVAKPDVQKIQTPENHGSRSALMASARSKLVHSRPVQAQIQQTIHIGAQKYDVSGTYAEGANNKLRMSLSMETPNCKGELLQVCDGQILWTELKRTSDQLAPEGHAKITRCDIGNILQNARFSQNKGNANLISDLAVGGLTSLLASLDEAIDFSDEKEITLDGKQLKVIEGGWKEQFLQDQGTEPDKKLARHVPNRIRIYLDGETLFPRRIQFLKTRAEEESEQSLVTLDFRDIVLNAPVSNEDFQYNPDDQLYDDITHKYLLELDQAKN